LLELGFSFISDSYFTQIGCYADSLDRDLNVADQLSSQMTLEICNEFCLAAGTTYFGVQVRIFDANHLVTSPKQKEALLRLSSQKNRSAEIGVRMCRLLALPCQESYYSSFWEI